MDATRRARLIEVGVIRTASSADPAERLLIIADRFEALLTVHKPDAVAVERVFAQHNVRTVMGTAQVAGLALTSAARHRIPVHTHTPTEVKAAVTGYGRADKTQVGAMVAKILGLADAPKPADAADALALALCHAWRSAAAAPNQHPATPAQLAWRAAEMASSRGARA